MIDIVLFVSHFILFTTLTVVFVCLTFYIYKNYHDINFLQGIFISAFLNFIFTFVISLYFSFIFIEYLFGFIFGISAGAFNKNLKRAALCGASGIYFSWVPPLFSGLLYFWGIVISNVIIIGSVYFYLQTMIPLIICGAIGGIIGSKINSIRKSRQNSEKPEMLEKKKD